MILNIIRTSVLFQGGNIMHITFENIIGNLKKEIEEEKKVDTKKLKVG
ncbi:hypothetical protein B425_0843 [Bacillus amyloliquefaciens]|nr:hypothetical protein B425_0843 [Bacillus amyloliquefaciens]